MKNKLAPYGTDSRLLLTANLKSCDTKTRTKIGNPNPDKL